MRKLRTIEMKRLSLDEFKEAEKLPLIVVLDDVRSLYNVGSVFRCGDAFRGNTSKKPKTLYNNFKMMAILCTVLNRLKAQRNFKNCTKALIFH